MGEEGRYLQNESCDTLKLNQLGCNLMHTSFLESSIEYNRMYFSVQ